ncbi:hypothetical protein B0H17DRAFT_1085097 [Mycena rosella]|uniref:DUF6534 domain-containing protein n=1 Tax=Mycena rosella TaxID=1033263 RepID=A0AAD7GAK8_MYCRO|nr:hypothetical protein B0H17DRAFT_1085097 [Mycena rosella]
MPGRNNSGDDYQMTGGIMEKHCSFPSLMASPYPPGYIDALPSPAMIGFTMMLPLYGVGVAQGAYYYRSFLEDPIYVKGVIGLLFFIDTTHTVCMVKSFNDWFLAGLFGPTTPRIFAVSMSLAYTTIWIVQCCYAARLWFLSGKNKFITLVVLALSFGQFGGGLGQSILTADVKNISVAHSSPFEIAGRFELICSLACDLVITGAMVYYLKSGRATSGIRRTSDVVNKIIVYIISVGLLTSIGTAINIALWLAMPQNFDFLILHLVLSKLSFNSLLVMLNARVKLREQLYSDAPIELSSGKGTSRA